MSDSHKIKVEEQTQDQKMGIGEQLKTQRKARGISLVEVTEHTKIGKKYLEALEEEKYDFLPCVAYIQGFLRAYAKYLELDDDKLIKQYHQEHSNEKNQDDENQGEEREKGNNQSVWMPLLLMIILAGLGAGVFLLWPSEQVTEETVQETVVPSSVTNNLDIMLPAPERAGQMLDLKIRAKEQTWITLMIDGKQEPDITLAANEQRQWQAKDRFVLWTGNAGGIEVYFNGQLQPTLGKQGEVRKEVIFERNKPVVEPLEE